MQSLHDARELFLLLVVILAFAGCVSSDSTITPPSLVVKSTPTILHEAETVTLCDLVAKPEFGPYFAVGSNGSLLGLERRH